MEFLIAVTALLGFIYLIAIPIVAFVALARSSRVSREVGNLNRSAHRMIQNAVDDYVARENQKPETKPSQELKLLRADLAILSARLDMLENQLAALESWQPPATVPERPAEVATAAPFVAEVPVALSKLDIPTLPAAGFEATSPPATAEEIQAPPQQVTTPAMAEIADLPRPDRIDISLPPADMAAPEIPATPVVMPEIAAIEAPIETPVPSSTAQEATTAPPSSWQAPQKTFRQDAETRPASHTPLHRPPPHSEPGLIENMVEYARNWLFGGNTLVRIGLILLFLGLTFLLRYASTYIEIPLEARYIGVALTALLGLGLGWRLRLKRPDFALLMQGAAVGIMYLTVFAALKLHDSPLLPHEAGFALLVAVAALAAFLAITQNAIAMAMAGALGGFAAPVLVSAGGGNHVVLFSYFALLNTGILATAWFKTWRPLNLIGFFGTFLIGMGWGLRHYNPAEHYESMQAFLILFFLMFVAIGLLFARRVLMEDDSTPESRDAATWKTWLAQQGHRAQRYLDGTLLFGTPIAAFSLQYGIIRHVYPDYGTAFSALALGLFYLVLARLVHGGNPWRCRLLVEVFLALGMIFASLAIPLGLDAQWTSAVWAVEGAGIYWIGLRQQRPLARLFALLLQAGAVAAFLSRLTMEHDAISLINGSAMGALMLGLSLLCNALLLRRYACTVDDNGEESRDFSLNPFFVSVGLWSLFLIPPLLLLKEGTVIGWAIAGLTALFIALKWRLAYWLGNALIVQLLAAALFLTTLSSGIDTPLSGDARIALLLGLVMLVQMQLLQLYRKERAGLQILLSSPGLWLLYLIAPLTLQMDHMTAAWALAGVATAFVGIRFRLRGWLSNALLVQVLAGVLFIGHIQSAGSGTHVLAFGGSGLKGLVMASLIGLAMMASLFAVIREARAANNPALARGLSWLMIIGLSFIVLGVLFVLPWASATAVWAVCGLLLMWAAMSLRLKPMFWFALGLEIVAGFAFIKTTVPGLVSSAMAFAGDASAFGHSGFWTPAVIALAAFATAWRLRQYASKVSESEAPTLGINGDLLSLPALIWYLLWWSFAWYAELSRIAAPQDLHHFFLLAMSATVLLHLLIVHTQEWKRLALLSIALLPLTLSTILHDYHHNVHPFNGSGVMAYLVAFAAHLALLRTLRERIPELIERWVHLFSCWIWLAVAAFEMRHLFLVLGDEGSVWRWLGWVIPLAAWLLWNARRDPPSLWPAALFPQLYRFTATLPVVIILLGWLFMANFSSSGNAAPLPYVPLVNPLEIGLLLVLFSAWQWRRRLAEQDPDTLSWQALHEPLKLVLFAGLFLIYTFAVLRGVHHLTPCVPTLDAPCTFSLGHLSHSMTAQTALSIAWMLYALALMIIGNIKGARSIWIVGVILVAVVVTKLIFIDGSSHGSLQRIISFIGVGILLLIVGYFAPLPPKAQTSD